MRTGHATVIGFIALASVLLVISASGHETAIDDAIELINDRLSHSSIMRITDDGLVKMKTPGGTITFNIKEVSFNYNDRNDDDRVRILSEYQIEVYEDDHLEEVLHRQSFLCKSEKHAYEAISGLRRLKELFIEKDEKLKRPEVALKAGDPTVRYTTVNEAIDYVNDSLVLSWITRVDEKGTMVINAPSNLYKVDLKRAEFGFNDLQAEPNLRIYGEWCIRIYDEDEEMEEIPRESFQVHSRNDAYRAIKALYDIKSAYAGSESAKGNSLRDGSKAVVIDYSTVQQAVDFINDRLEISIIMTIDDSGMATVNSPENIFKFDVMESRFSRGTEAQDLVGFLKNAIKGGTTDSVLVRCQDGIEQYEAGHLDRTIDEQTFQCKSRSEVDDVVEAFEFIQRPLGKVKR